MWYLEVWLDGRDEP